MMTAEFEPSSSVTRFMPARLRMRSPTSTLPVNVTMAMRLSKTSMSPIAPPGPVITFSAPAGNPHSSKMPAMRTAEIGVVEAGLWTTLLPPASAGPILCIARFSGKLNGVMAAITPSGSRTVMAQWPLPAGDASIGTTSPCNRCASSEENSSVMAERSTSMRASLIGLPVSELTAIAISSRSLEQFLIGLAQDGGALVERHLPHDRRRRDSGRDRGIDLLLGGLINRADLGAVVRQLHRARLGARDRLSADVHRVFHTS